MALDRDTVLAVLKRHFATEAQKAMTYTRRKDGIDVQYTTYAIEAFAEEVFQMGRADAEAEIAAKFHLTPV